MQVEHSISIAAPPAQIFRIYAAVDQWHTWDPDTEAASLSGPFAVGTRGRLTPSKGRPVPMVLTEVVPERSFTVESRIPLLRLRFEHELVAGRAATAVTHRVLVSGLLSYLIGPGLVRQLDRGLPKTLANLKRLAEGED
jgi:uncharacterized protein YndB with AHSA1/START domain